MIITYFRSSSFNTHTGCPMDYTGQYVLGWRGPSNLKADKGTIVHKVLEILAVAKKGKQDGLKFIEDEIVGKVSTTYFDINELCEKVFNYYARAFVQHAWSDKDFDDIKKWTWKAITYNDGMFDPRKRKIVAPELHFDFAIDKPWAKYDYMHNGVKLEGQLELKGTIDLITEIGDGFYEVIDWKTGRRLDWNTGEEKTQEKLQKDPQLMLYYYALSHVFPNVKQVMVTIFFINDGGPFSICFSPEDLIETEDMIRRKFEVIKQTKVPRLNKSWKCSKLCHFGKTTFEGTHIKPLIENRDGQQTKKGQCMSKCEQLLYEITNKGIDKVTEEYVAPGHVIGRYQAPGSAE